MPILEYRCGSCGAEFECLVRSGERPPCRKCGAPPERLERRFSRFAVGASSGSDPETTAGCGRCGDPTGPCGERAV